MDSNSKSAERGDVPPPDILKKARTEGYDSGFEDGRDFSQHPEAIENFDVDPKALASVTTRSVETPPPAPPQPNAYRKKPVVIEAIQWFKDGDHAEVKRWRSKSERGGQCQHCTVNLAGHGWIETLESGHIVCPGDWIIRGVQGEFYPCKPDIFAQTYEPASRMATEAGKPAMEECCHSVPTRGCPVCTRNFPDEALRPRPEAASAGLRCDCGHSREEHRIICAANFCSCNRRLAGSGQ